MLGKIQEDLADLDKLNSTQGQLADYNLLVDKLNTDTERAEVKLEILFKPGLFCTILPRWRLNARN